MNTKETISIEMDSGHTLEIEAELEWSFDSSYGADADGNRGVPVWSVDDITYDVPKHLSNEREELWDKVRAAVNNGDYEPPSN